MNVEPSRFRSFTWLVTEHALSYFRFIPMWSVRRITTFFSSIETGLTDSIEYSWRRSRSVWMCVVETEILSRFYWSMSIFRSKLEAMTKITGKHYLVFILFGTNPLSLSENHPRDERFARTGKRFFDTHRNPHLIQCTTDDQYILLLMHVHCISRKISSDRSTSPVKDKKKQHCAIIQGKTYKRTRELKFERERRGKEEN